MARITLENIAHSYRPKPNGLEDYALKPLNHLWEHGGAYALLGPSGCGKTTLLNVISGLVTPSKGRVLFDGNDVTLLPTEKRNIAQVFQFPVIYDTMTVYENLAFPLKNRGVARHEIDRRVREIARMLDLEASLARKAHGLTADAKQKISVGRGLVRVDVNAILFDEPLTVIDPHLKWQLRSQLKQLHHDLDITMVYVTHDQTEALTFADKVIVMFQGEVVQVGTPQELFEHPRHTFVGYFIGSPGMNVMPCTVEDGHAIVAGHRVAVKAAAARMPLQGKLEIGIRPEFITLSGNGAGLPVRIRQVSDLGRYKIADVELHDVPLKVMVSERAVIDGDQAKIVFDPLHLHLYADGHIVEESGFEGAPS